MRAYSLDLRERVMKAYDEGSGTVREIAKQFRVGEWWIYKLKRQRQQTGSLEVRRGRVGQPRKLGPKELNRLKKYVEKHEGATLKKISQKLLLQCSEVTIHNTLRRLGYRYKKTLWARGAIQSWCKVRQSIRDQEGDSRKSSIDY